MKDKKLYLIFVFAKSDAYNPPSGVVEIDEERLAIWSSLRGTLLTAAISAALFEGSLFTGVVESWNSMVEFVGWVSRTLYPDSVRDGVFGIWADSIANKIGVPPGQL